MARTPNLVPCKYPVLMLPPEISADTLAQQLKSPVPPLLLDVREPWEAETASIPGSALMPMGDVPSRAHQELDPDQPIVVLCHHGARSLNVTMWLVIRASSTSSPSPAASTTGPALSIPPSPVTDHPMSAQRTFDAELAALEALRDGAPEAADQPLRKALALRNNFIVAKAATLAAHHNLRGLADDLAAAFPRFLANPVKSDPQCWAKNAIAKTLAAFEYQEPDLFLAGLRHIQLEPVWGGRSDTAGALRSTCALALVQCRSLSSLAVLTHLTPLFADKETPVRVDAARAVEQIGTDAASLLLRLRAELGSDDSEVLGACYAGVLRLEGPAAIPWAAKFLPPTHEPDDTAAEAALAIAETRTEAAFNLLRTTYDQVRDTSFRATLLTAIALTRQEAATKFLLSLIADGYRDAHEALCRSAPSEVVREALATLGHPCP